MKIAALDVGTNTVLMLVAEAQSDGRVRPVLELARITRLGRGVDRNGVLDPESAGRTLEAIAEFVQQARAAGAARIVAAATSVLRDACDGAGFVSAVRARTGVELEIISGQAEAQLCHLAVRRGLNLDRGARLLIADIGGGSTELVRAEPGRELAIASLQIGAVRLTERIIRHDPPAKAELKELLATIDQALGVLRWDYQPDLLVGIAGTVTSVCAVALGAEPYDHTRVHGHILARGEVERVLGRFASLGLAERRRLKGLAEGRADVIVAGAMILARIMDHFHAGSVVVSDQGVRWGLVWRELERAGSRAAQN